MAVTRLTDVIVPEVFTPYMMKLTKEKSAIFQSGILRDDPVLANFLCGGGRTANVPFWRDLANTQSNTATDDPSDVASPDNISAGRDLTLLLIRTMGWSSAKLFAELDVNVPQSPM